MSKSLIVTGRDGLFKVTCPRHWDRAIHGENDLPVGVVNPRVCVTGAHAESTARLCHSRRTVIKMRAHEFAILLLRRPAGRRESVGPGSPRFLADHIAGVLAQTLEPVHDRKTVKGYRYRVFVSYSRTQSSMRWVRKLVVPMLQDYIHDQLGGKDTVFDDQQLRDGAYFDEQLYEKLSESALLVPILTAAYFESEWCRREFAAMREREEHLGFRKNGDTRTLIIPIYLSGRRSFPERYRTMQCTDFWEYNNPDLAEGTVRRAEFNDAIRRWSDELVHAWERTVPWQENFRTMRGEAFFPDLDPTSQPVEAPSMISPVVAVA